MVLAAIGGESRLSSEITAIGGLMSVMAPLPALSKSLAAFAPLNESRVDRYRRGGEAGIFPPQLLVFC
jgi:hypothetical protein